MEEVASGNKEALLVIDELKKMAKDETLTLFYDAEVEHKKRELGKYDLGVEEEKLNTATRMLEESFDLDVISKMTELPIDQIEKIKKQRELK